MARILRTEEEQLDVGPGQTIANHELATSLNQPEIKTSAQYVLSLYSFFYQMFYIQNPFL